MYDINEVELAIKYGDMNKVVKFFTTFHERYRIQVNSHFICLAIENKQYKIAKYLFDFCKKPGSGKDIIISSLLRVLSSKD